MTTLGIYGGALKSTLIERAFGMCGQSITEFELTPEEYTLGLRCLNDVAATFPATLGYNMPNNGDGNPEDESGILRSDELGITVLLAQEIAQNIGKTFSPNKKQAQASSILTGRYLTLVPRELARQTIRGAGNRYWNGPDPFFRQATPEDEVAQ
ncbi:hypothetical protein [Sphingomonas sp.]|uniref:hypothetical protein n=1 Tax=Sphingomonas sp. TaxID=28214 RepID=UPI0031DCE1AF